MTVPTAVVVANSSKVGKKLQRSSGRVILLEVYQVSNCHLHPTPSKLNYHDHMDCTWCWLNGGPHMLPPCVEPVPQDGR